MVNYPANKSGKVFMQQIVIDQGITNIAAGILKAKRVVVFTGAGVSTESGIPDFRSPGGIWTKFDPEDFTIHKFLSSSETRKKQWRILVESGLLSKAEPNRAHMAIADLEVIGKLDCVITQNIDNLHQKAGNSPDIVFELHGNMNRAKCLACGAAFPMEQALKQLDKGDEPNASHAPACSSRTLSFSESRFPPQYCTKRHGVPGIASFSLSLGLRLQYIPRHICRHMRKRRAQSLPLLTPARQDMTCRPTSLSMPGLVM